MQRLCDNLVRKYEIRLGSAEFKAVTVEITRASWGAAIFSGVAKYIYFLRALGWLFLQFVSMLIDSIKENKETP